MLNKLKIIKNVTVYSTERTWETYKDVISVIKNNILENKIKVDKTRYIDDFAKEYNPYTNEKNWGTNLDEFIITLNDKLEATLTYYYIPRFASQFDRRQFKFQLSFTLAKEMLGLFKYEIDSKFHDKCLEIREQELEKIEINRVKEIGRELLKRK